MSRYVLLAAIGLLSLPAQAQVDAVQRVFPGEAARVLGWLRALEGPPIGAVEWAAESGSPAGLRGRVKWIDARGALMRERRVEIDAAQLASGPGFYREVWRQLCGDGWALPSASPDNSAAAFWQGAELAGVSRTEAITAARKLLADQPRVARAADAARLAGVLVHGAVPSLGGRRAIDDVSLARGAAWLCVAEARLREPFAAAWAPVLFLAGRELEAGELWQRPEAKTKLRTGAERFWALALVEPPLVPAFVFAARKENRAWAAPAMFLFTRKDDRLEAAVREIGRAQFDAAFAARLHDYAPVLGGDGAEAWARLAREMGNGIEPGTKAGPVAAIAAADLALARPEPTARAPGSRLSGLDDAGAAALAQTALAAVAEAPAPGPGPQPADTGRAGPRERPAFTNADAAWAWIEQERKRVEAADSPEDRVRRMREQRERWREAGEAFCAAFPQDPRRWDAVILVFEAMLELRRLGGDGKAPDAAALEALQAAPDASAAAKGSAEFLRLLLRAPEGNALERHALPAFQLGLAEFIERHPRHPRAQDAAGMLMQMIEQVETPGADRLLERLTAVPAPQIAGAARAQREQRARFVELKREALELKFTASDGRVVDAAALRGKVVLLDFWASWCGPCLAEAPHVASAYEKLRERGFEIIGVNLDEDRGAMESAARQHRMTWPHHHDGKGWRNELAQRFGIRSIPATWLFDKAGRLREVGLRGAELEAGVERLLRE